MSLQEDVLAVAEVECLVLYVLSGEGRCSGEIMFLCRQPFCLALILAAPATSRESDTGHC